MPQSFFWNFDTPPLSDEPWWKWENWKIKGRKCHQLKFSCFDVIELYANSYTLLIKQEQKHKEGGEKRAAEEHRRNRTSMLTTVTKNI